jgi:hypothetical protein
MTTSTSLLAAPPPVRMGVVIPVGPGTEVDDTLHSVLAFNDDVVVALVDDSDRDLSQRANARTIVVPAPSGAPGGQGGLWVKVTAGYRALLQRATPGLVVKMDTDALFLATGLAERADAVFDTRPDVGLLGAHRTSPDGSRRDFGSAARLLRAELGARGLRDRHLRRHLRRLVAAAGPDYEYGEHALGGAYIHRGTVVMAMLRAGLLDAPVLARSRLGEDHLMALATLAAGYQIADFSRPGDPMAVKWRGLPMSPQDLIATDAMITHSINYWNGMDEAAVREFFAARRPAPVEPDNQRRINTRAASRIRPRAEDPARERLR